MPDLGRFFNIDPLADKYRKWSPYTFSGNIVINAREIEGLEPHILFGSIDAAAENFGQQYNGLSIIINREYGSTIYSVKTSVKGVESIQFAYSQPAIGDSGDAVTPSLPPNGTTSVADAHTHSAYDPAYDNNIFSGSKSGNNLTSKDGDIGDNNKTGLTGYIATSNGSLQKYDPKSGFISTVSTNLPSDSNDPTRLNNISPVISPTVTIPPLPTNPPTITSPKIETEIGKP
jgi:hypothetical protein